MRYAALLLCFCGFYTTASAQVVINEVGIAPSAGSGEFVELFNRNGCATDLSCYTLIFSGTSSSGNPTGWTIKIPSGKSISAGGYFLIGGTAGTAGVFNTGYPTGGAVTSYPGIADVNAGSLSITANAVFMKQSLSAGMLPNSAGQLTLLNASGVAVAIVSYNNGNNNGSYPLSAYTTCNTAGNTQGNNNIANPGASAANVNATFTSATIQGIYLNASGTYQTETTLTPRSASTGNGGTQVCSGPVLNTVNNISCCFSSSSQSLPLIYTAVNAPTLYSISWNALPANSFSTVLNAAIPGSGISIIIPGNTAAGVYTGSLLLSNNCGQSCNQNFSVTVLALPVVSAGNYLPLCINSAPVILNGSPAGGTFSGTGVTGNSFVATVAGNFIITYSYTDAITGCANTTTAPIIVSSPVSSYSILCATISPYLFYGQTLNASGLYAALVPNVNGCMDTARLYLTMKKSVVIDSTGCDSVLYEGVNYYTSITFNQTIQSVVSGCDSVVKNVRVHINRSKVKDTTVCLPPGGTFSLSGQSFPASGLYILHGVTATGCDSMVRLHLTVAKTQVVDSSACGAVIYQGTLYVTDTTFAETIAATNGCDSILRSVKILIRQPSHSLTLACAAPGQSYLFNGQVYTVAGLYTTHLTNSVGCDSAAQLYLTMAAASATALQSCISIVYNGIVYATSTIVYDTIKSKVTGCDSLIKKVVITISPQLHTTTTICAQEGDVILFNAQPITTNGWYTAQLTTSAGCDSIVAAYIIFKKITTASLSGCDSVLYNNTWQHQSTVVSDTVKSTVSGCDSLVKQVTVTVKASKKITVYACANEGATYLFNGLPLISSGWHSAHFITADGCDSLVNLYIVFAKTQAQTFTGCDSALINNHLYYQSVVERDTVKSIVSLCDSLIRIKNIVINNRKDVYVTGCSSTGAYLFFGQLLSSSGLYSHTLNTVTGCDSIIHLYLVVTARQNQLITGCDSVLYNGSNYYATTILSDTIRSAVTGCDSLISQVQISVGHTLHTTASLCLPAGQTYNFDGQAISASGIYTTTYHNGCDSIVRLYVVVAKLQAATISGCDSVWLNGVRYTSSVTLRDTIRSVITFCDSLYSITHINVLHRSANYINACIKAGEIYNFNGQLLSVTGTYSTTYFLPGGCDSMVNLYLLASAIRQEMRRGCDSVSYNGISYTSSAIISDTVRSSLTSCDSIIHIVSIQVDLKPPLTVSKDVTICKGDSVQLMATSDAPFITWTGSTPSASIWVKPAATAIYSVTATDTNNCINQRHVTVSVQDFIVDLTASPASPFAGQPVLFQTTSALPYAVLSWEPASIFINQPAKTQRLIADTTLPVFVVAQSFFGCKDTAFTLLAVMPLDDVYVASAFTPNGDGKNDMIRVVGNSIKEVDFKIFNRWGQLIFYTTDKYGSWDGKRNGVLQPAGIYVHVIKVKKISGQVIEKKGTVTLIR